MIAVTDFCRRMKLVYFTLICAFAVLIAFSTRQVAAAPPLQCSPGFQQDEDLPLKLREVCDALSTFYELSNAMEAYVDEKGKIISFKN